MRETPFRKNVREIIRIFIPGIGRETEIVRPSVREDSTTMLIPTMDSARTVRTSIGSAVRKGGKGSDKTVEEKGKPETPGLERVNGVENDEVLETEDDVGDELDDEVLETGISKANDFSFDRCTVFSSETAGMPIFWACGSLWVGFPWIGPHNLMAVASKL